MKDNTINQTFIDAIFYKNKNKSKQYAVDIASEYKNRGYLVRVLEIE